MSILQNKETLLYNNFATSYLKEDLIIYITTTYDILNLKTSDASEVYEVRVNSNRVDYYVVLRPNRTVCPYCDGTNFESKGWTQNTIKDKPRTGDLSYVHQKYHKYYCHECHMTFYDYSPLSIPGMKISLRLVRLILEELKNANVTYELTAKRFDISPTTVINIFDKFLAIREKPLNTIICIDEIYVKPNTDRPYACVILDHQKKKLIKMLHGRNKIIVRNYFLGKKLEEREKVLYVCIDMWEPYLEVAEEVFPNATVAVDSFHVLQHLYKAMHDIRCRVCKNYDDNSNEYYLLKQVKDLLIKNEPLSFKKKYNKKFKKFLSEYDFVTMALSLYKDLNVAYNFFHAYKTFNDTATHENCESKFDAITDDLTDVVAIQELREFVVMIYKWKPYILNSFIRVNGDRLSNGPIEGTNKTLKKIRYISGKVDNFTRYVRRCFLVVNKEITFAVKLENKVKRICQKRGKYEKKKLEI